MVCCSEFALNLERNQDIYITAIDVMDESY